MKQVKTFLYQINVTRDCNLRCTHCYIHSDVKASSKSMQDEQIISLAHGIVAHMKKINYARAEIHFVGGEPTMLGLPFFQKNIPLFREIIEKGGFEADIMLISNLLHDDIVKIAKLFDKVNTSYEVDTRFVSTKGVYKPKIEKNWLDNLKKLQNEGIDLGVTTAITTPVIKFGATNLLNYFYDNGIKKMHFGFFIPEGDGLVNINNLFPGFHETSEFLIETAKWALERRESDADLWVNPFESMLTAIENDEPLDDIVCPIIAGSADINWDGNTVTCIEEGGSKTPDWAGNIFETSIVEVTSSAKFMKRVIEAAKPQRYCVGCEEYNFCKSGCGVLFKYFDPNLDQDCPGFKQFITFVRGKNESGIKPKSTKYLGKSC
jgi:radical SAM protein with 4Fe4S-binding SPASM domain